MTAKEIKYKVKIVSHCNVIKTENNKFDEEDLDFILQSNKYETQIKLNNKSINTEIEKRFSYKCMRKKLLSTDLYKIEEEILEIKKLIMLSKKLRNADKVKSPSKYALENHPNLKYLSLKHVNESENVTKTFVNSFKEKVKKSLELLYGKIPENNETKLNTQNIQSNNNLMDVLKTKTIFGKDTIPYLTLSKNISTNNVNCPILDNSDKLLFNDDYLFLESKKIEEQTKQISKKDIGFYHGIEHENLMRNCSLKCHLSEEGLDNEISSLSFNKIINFNTIRQKMLKTFTMENLLEDYSLNLQKAKMNTKYLNINENKDIKEKKKTDLFCKLNTLFSTRDSRIKTDDIIERLKIFTSKYRTKFRISDIFNTVHHDNEIQNKQYLTMKNYINQGFNYKQNKYFDLNYCYLNNNNNFNNKISSNDYLFVSQERKNYSFKMFCLLYNRLKVYGNPIQYLYELDSTAFTIINYFFNSKINIEKESKGMDKTDLLIKSINFEKDLLFETNSLKLFQVQAKKEIKLNENNSNKAKAMKSSSLKENININPFEDLECFLFYDYVFIHNHIIKDVRILKAFNDLKHFSFDLNKLKIAQKEIEEKKEQTDPESYFNQNMLNNNKNSFKANNDIGGDPFNKMKMQNNLNVLNNIPSISSNYNPFGSVKARDFNKNTSGKINSVKRKENNKLSNFNFENKNKNNSLDESKFSDIDKIDDISRDNDDNIFKEQESFIKEISSQPEFRDKNLAGSLNKFEFEEETHSFDVEIGNDDKNRDDSFAFNSKHKSKFGSNPKISYIGDTQMVHNKNEDIIERLNEQIEVSDKITNLIREFLVDEIEKIEKNEEEGEKKKFGLRNIEKEKAKKENTDFKIFPKFPYLLLVTKDKRFIITNQKTLQDKNFGKIYLNTNLKNVNFYHLKKSDILEDTLNIDIIMSMTEDEVVKLDNRVFFIMIIKNSDEINLKHFKQITYELHKVNNEFDISKTSYFLICINQESAIQFEYFCKEYNLLVTNLINLNVPFKQPKIIENNLMSTNEVTNTKINDKNLKKDGFIDFKKDFITQDNKDKDEEKENSIFTVNQNSFNNLNNNNQRFSIATKYSKQSFGNDSNKNPYKRDSNFGIVSNMNNVNSYSFQNNVYNFTNKRKYSDNRSNYSNKNDDLGYIESFGDRYEKKDKFNTPSLGYTNNNVEMNDFNLANNIKRMSFNNNNFGNNVKINDNSKQILADITEDNGYYDISENKNYTHTYSISDANMLNTSNLKKIKERMRKKENLDDDDLNNVMEPHLNNIRIGNETIFCIYQSEKFILEFLGDKLEMIPYTGDKSIYYVLPLNAIKILNSDVRETNSKMNFRANILLEINKNKLYSDKNELIKKSNSIIPEKIEITFDNQEHYKNAFKFMSRKV